MVDKFNSVQDEILHHMARAFFVSAFADLQDDKFDRGEESVCASMGQDWMNVAPEENDPAAVEAAQELMTEMVSANKVPEQWRCGLGLEYLMNQAREIQARTGKTGDRELNPEMFGHYCAMQAMGHGVGLGDSFGQAVRDAIKVPYVEFGFYSLEKDY